MVDSRAKGLRKFSQIRFLAPTLHAILFIATWGLYSVSSQPMMNGWSGWPFGVLMLADIPISVVAFGVLFGGSKDGTVVIVLWGVLGTLWWYFIGRLITALIRKFRKSPQESNQQPGTWGAWLVGMTALVSLLSIGFLWTANRYEKSEYGGEIREIAFCPDKQAVLLVRTEGESSFLYKADLSSGTATRLTHNTAGQESSASYSPDGSTIVFTYTAQGERDSQLFVMQADGSHMRHLFYDQKETSDFFPLFAPSGRIVFARQNTASMDSRWNAYSVGVDGSDLKQITSAGFSDVFLESVSSDGKRLLLESRFENERFEIYSLETNSIVSTLQPRVRSAPSSNIYANGKFLPDGKSIIFMAASEGKKAFDYDVYRLEIESNALDKLTNENGYATALNVSADGQEALFLKWTSKYGSLPVNSKLYVMDLGTLQVRETPITGRANN